MSIDPAVFNAFAIGVLSAVSLPLGAATSKYWRPQGRILAFLMAFGAGALLAALTIDLVAPALTRNEYPALASGCLLGSILFIVLNQIVNYNGGFLRKSSTMINYIQRQRMSHFKRVLSQIRRLPIFHGLDKREQQSIVEGVLTRDYPQGSTLFKGGDPADRIYIIDEGEIEMHDPSKDTQPITVLKKGDAFGWKSFLTGAPHHKFTLTRTDVKLWILTKENIQACLKSCPKLRERLCKFLKDGRIQTYLQEEQGMSTADIDHWIETAIDSLHTRAELPQAVNVERESDEFKHIIREIKRVPFFSELEPDDVEDIAKLIFIKHHEKGYTFFHQNEYADRMYIIKTGEVALIDPENKKRTLYSLSSSDAFGAMAFMTGAPHTVSAVGSTDTVIWVLLKRDFIELLKKSQRLKRVIQNYLQHEQMNEYLAEKQHLDEEQTERWQKKALLNLGSGQLAPSPQDMIHAFKEHKGAPLAIWLGILMDSIPESLVIGSSMIHSHVSLSLLAGVFLSNYPEALSSSVGMKQQGYNYTKIIIAWTLIMLVTGVGAALGRVFLVGIPSTTYTLIQGIAAGSMLTMIAETMLPEAYYKGGSVVGISTLCGFLMALFFKTLH